MESNQSAAVIVELCAALRTETGCDFAGLALQDAAGPHVRWVYASGNVNEKYKRITVRYGKGIAGKVIAAGTPISVVHLDRNSSGIIEQPIMLAEHLLAAYAVPIFIGGIAKGALLAGYRESCPFIKEKQRIIQAYAHKIEGLF